MSKSALLLLLASPLAWAQSAPPPPTLGGSLVQMLLGLAVVIAVLIGGLWLLKRVQNTGTRNPNLVRVVGGTALGPRERVVIVELGQNWLVLGVTPNCITTLSEMPRQPLPQAPAHEVPKWLRKMLEKKHGRPQA